MGTWALPQTIEKAKELQKILNEPLTADEAENKIYHLLGDDDLFDHITRARKKYGKDYDVRGIIVFSLQDMVCNYGAATNPWNKEALKICNEICSMN